MNNTRTSAGSLTSSAPWIAVALVLGSVVGWLDLSATEVQGSVLMVMLVGFASALPGQASFVLLGIAAGIGIPLVHAIVDPGTLSAGTALAVIPGILGALGGRIAGTLLNLAGSAFETEVGPDNDFSDPWYRRHVGVRVLLALTLTAVAMFGLPLVTDAVTGTGTRAPLFVALVWQISSYVGWIALTPSIVRVRAALRPDTPHHGGVALMEAVMHVGVLAGLVVVHAVALVLLNSALHLSFGPGGLSDAFIAAVRVYAPLDALVYSAVLGIAFSSDAARFAKERVTREAALTKEATEAKLESLRAQLNPHFLYNALNSAVVLASSGDQTRVVATLEQLSTMLRYVLDEKRSLVPLGVELEFVQRYLEIQQIRFGDRMRFSIAHFGEVDQLLVPPLILQPLVENAVEHGIGAAIAGGSVTVSAIREADTLVLKVEDDGQGISADRSSEKIGLGNTRGRLETMFGTASSVTLAQRDGGGAISVIRIPLTGKNAQSK
ncbi:MAG: sensor histidine kinase [Gemmatimonadales bacterium]